jgi:hypothetical protein
MVAAQMPVPVRENFEALDPDNGHGSLATISSASLTGLWPSGIGVTRIVPSFKMSICGVTPASFAAAKARAMSRILKRGDRLDLQPGGDFAMNFVLKCWAGRKFEVTPQYAQSARGAVKRDFPKTRVVKRVVI